MTRNFNPGLYVQDKSKTPDLTTALAPGFRGILLQMPWVSVEPQQGKYNFDNVRSLLEWGKVNDRQVVLMLFDRDFNTPAAQSKIVPRWVASEPFNKKQANGGCVAKLWLPAVTNARIALIKALSAEFGNHPNLEAIALQETALGGIEQSKEPEGYTHEKYCTQICRLIREVAPALNQIQLWQAINWLGPFDGPYLDRIAQAMFDTKAGGLTNPDSVKWEKDKKPMYAVMNRWADRLPIAFGGDTSQLEKPGEQYATFADLVRMQFDFATEHGAHYVFYNNGFTSRALSGGGIGKEYTAAVKTFVKDATMTVAKPSSLILEEVPPTPDPEPPQPQPDTSVLERLAMLEAAFATLRSETLANVATISTKQTANDDGLADLKSQWTVFRDELRELAN